MASAIESSSGNPYPSDPDVSNFVEDNLSGSNNYEQWREKMLYLINRYGLDGFITGTVKIPTTTVTIPEDGGGGAASRTKEIENQDFISWKASNDFLLKCIRKTLNEDIRQQVKFVRIAKGLWTRLEEMFRKPIRSIVSSCKSSPANYPYPSEFVVSEFVRHTLSRRNYSEWKEEMFDLIKQVHLVGFINGTVKAPPKRITAEDTGNGYSSSNLIENELYGAWKRSDDLLRKWIRSTLAEDIRQQVRLCRTARGLWTKLEKLLDQKTVKLLRQYQPLQMAAIYGDWESASKFIDGKPYAVRKPINEDSETALIVAIKSKQTIHFVRNLLEKMSTRDLALGDVNGWTALHTAVVAGNIEAVKLLVEKNESLPGVPDLDRQLPLFYAAKFRDKEMVDYLWPLTKGYPDEMGATLLCELVTVKFYDFALKLLKDDPMLACMEPSALLAIAKKPSSFSSGTPLNFLERVICWAYPIKLDNNASHHSGSSENLAHFDWLNDDPIKWKNIASHHTGRDIENPADFDLPNVKQRLHAMFWAVGAKLVPQINQIRDNKLNHDQALELVKLLCKEIAKSEFSSSTRIFTPPLIQAISEGIPQIVEQILRFYPNPVSLENENWQSIFQKAIGRRREEVFILINRREHYKKIFLTIEDESRNNALHLAGHLAPPQILRRRTGAALQMQRELQWFKEIEKIVPPGNKEEKNAEDMTPIEVFTHKHQELVKEAERWMKDTANSCTIVATLIATVVFAAAITVPGGNNSDSGQPIFFKQHAFFLFGIFDALALFSSISSVLMFLSITTSRYAVEDFLYALPNRLIIGLGTLFFSILSTMIAFSATLYLVFGENRSWIRIPIVVLACVPVIIFVALQLPLFVEIIKSTYGRGIFGKMSDHKLSDRGLQKSGEETESKTIFGS